jgi:hypothetical protein
VKRRKWGHCLLTSRAGRTAAGLALLGSLCFVAPIALALVPGSERVANAIVARNAAAGRAQALRFELEMRIDEGPVVARGELVTHPSGMARLELQGTGDLVEKHLLQGTAYLASRNQKHLPEPRAFLPPLFLFQIDSAEALRSALIAYRIHPDQIGLAPCDENDCYVLGDPERVPPRPPGAESPGAHVESGDQVGLLAGFGEDTRAPEGWGWDPTGVLDVLSPEDRAALGLPPKEEVAPPELSAAEGEEDSDGDVDPDRDPNADPEEVALDGEEVDGEEGMGLVFNLAPGELPATLWIDMQTLDPHGMRLASGAQVRFGPYMKFGRVRVPVWVEIEEERGTVRFDVVEVKPVSAPAAAFDASWLVAPAASMGPPAAPSGVPAGVSEKPRE